MTDTTEVTISTAPPISDIDALRLMVRGAYDLQALRMQTGLRLCANFRSRLTDQPAEEPGGRDELSKEALDVIKKLKASYRRLTDGIAKNRTLPDAQNFKGDHLISTFAELVLVHGYVNMEKQETQQFALMEGQLDKIPIYTSFLRDQVGIGHAMAGVLITYLDPHKAERISDWWAYCGIDVAGDGLGRSRRKEHLVEREYTKKNGQRAKRWSVTYNPFLKTKMTGVLGPCFLRSEAPWREHYDRYKHRIISDPERPKITTEEWKKRHAAGEPVHRTHWRPGRIHQASVRYMLKIFLQDFWLAWRKLEGLPVTLPYNEAVLGHKHAA